MDKKLFNDCRYVIFHCPPIMGYEEELILKCVGNDYEEAISEYNRLKIENPGIVLCDVIDKIEL